MNLSTIRNIMRKDSGISGDAQRLEQLVGLIFMKWATKLESGWSLSNSDYQTVFPIVDGQVINWKYITHKDAKDSRINGDELLNLVNQIYETIKEKADERLTPERKMIVDVFKQINQYMKDGYLLHDVIGELEDNMPISTVKDRHAFGEMYEQMLRELQSAGSAGEFYTPRPVVDFIVNHLKPQLGERFADFACGTGGFLTSALNYVREHNSPIEGANNNEKFQNLVSGGEWKPLPYLLAITNLIAHGIRLPNISQGDSLKRAGQFIDYKTGDKFDVIAMNPPYGGTTGSESKSVAPTNMQSSETADLFIAQIMYSLKEDGRAGVIIPDGFLFGDNGPKRAIKEYLVQNFNLHTIIRLPQSIFAPYTSIATNILFFDNKKADGAPKGFSTKETWVYRIDMPDGIKHFSKTKPVRSDLFNDANLWWDSRREIIIEPGKDEKSRCFAVEQLRSLNYNLDLCKYPKQEEVIIPLNEFKQHFDQNVMQQLQTINQDLDEIFKVINE